MAKKVKNCQGQSNAVKHCQRWSNGVKKVKSCQRKQMWSKVVKHSHSVGREECGLRMSDFGWGKSGQEWPRKVKGGQESQEL